jgi:hypothetical protein
MRNHLSILSVIFMIFAAACNKEAKNVILPDFQQKLVVNSFISPSDTVSVVKISSNKRIYGDLDETETLGNLSATISDGNKTINLIPASSGFKFRPDDMRITEGNTYYLSVVSDKGLSAQAECTVPLKHHLIIEADTTKVIVNYGFTQEPEIHARIYLTDAPGEQNFYRFSCKMIEYTSLYHHNPQICKIIGTENDIFSDADNDGKKIFANSISVSETVNIVDCDSTFIVIYIQNTDKAYYDFHRSLSKYSGGANPFAEASPVFSNITGGLGIFASYTIDSMVLRLK